MSKKPTYEELEQRIKELEEEVSHNKKAEETLRDLEARLRSMDDLSPYGILTTDLLGVVTSCNRAFLRLTGYGQTEIKGKHFTMLPTLLKKDLDTYVNMFRGIIAGKSYRPFEFKWRHKDQSMQVGQAYIGPLKSAGEIKGVQILLEDIMARKRAEESLIASERKFRSIMEQSTDLIALTDARGVITYASPASRQMFAIDPEEMIGRPFAEFLDESSIPVALRAFQESMEKGNGAKNLELFMKSEDGSRFYGELSGSLYDFGTAKGSLVVIRDISERKQADIQQKKLQTQLANAMEMARLSPWEYDNINDTFHFSDFYYNVFRTTAQEVGGYTMSSEEYVNRFVPPDVRDEILEGIRVALDEADPDYGMLVEHPIVNGDGEPGYISVRSIVEKDENGRTIRTYGVSQDITEQKLAEEKLRESDDKLARSRKMESMGLLAGGVAHDLNNILSGIVSYPELILLDLPEDSELRKPIETILQSGERAVAIVQDLLTIARGAASTKVATNVNDIVNEYLASSDFKDLSHYHHAVHVKTDLDNELLNIKGSVVHIRKIIMNLVSNAFEAIETGGTVSITTRNCYVDKPLSKYVDVTMGEYAVLRISDDGSGIAPDNLEKIFEPFFTKKVMGRSGTGLGLAVVWNIVQDHDGYIDVSSNEGGTTFELYFPITREKLTRENLSPSMEDLKGSGEAILIVDDVEIQREITGSMLHILGYKSIGVSGGEEAVEYLKKNTVDLVLLDMIMDPGINGRETYERIIKIHPGQKAIITSGFAKTDDVKETQELGAGQYIKKPLTLGSIGKAIKQELEE